MAKVIELYWYRFCFLQTCYAVQLFYEAAINLQYWRSEHE